MHFCYVGHLLNAGQHFAQLRDVTHDGGGRQFFVRQKVDELLNAGGVDAAQIGVEKKFGDVGF